MKYVKGDDVKIVEQEYRQDFYDVLLLKNWIATIDNVIENNDRYPEKYYRIKEFLGLNILPEDIEDYADPIRNRFDILDIRE